MAVPDRGLRDKALNLINNVGNYGPLDATIDSYKQAADYADDARYWAELSGSVQQEIIQILEARITSLEERVAALEAKDNGTI